MEDVVSNASRIPWTCSGGCGGTGITVLATNAPDAGPLPLEFLPNTITLYC